MEQIISWFWALAERSPLFYLSLFGLSALNAFLPPIPIEGLTILGGFMAAGGALQSLWIWLATALGMILGNSALFFCIQSNQEFLLRRKVISKHLNQEVLDKGKGMFDRYGVWAVFISKFVPWMTFGLTFYFGLSKIPLYRILPALALSNLLYFGGLTLLGRYAKEEWDILVEMVKPAYLWIGLAALAVAGILFKLWRAKRKRNEL
jgi:membrane protein DedA with SNARE-associated domain